MKAWPKFCIPFEESGTSVQPVKRFSLFQELSPWRKNATLYWEGSDGQIGEPCLGFSGGLVTLGLGGGSRSGGGTAREALHPEEAEGLGASCEVTTVHKFHQK